VRWRLRGLSNKVLRTFESEQVNLGTVAAPVLDLQGWSWKKDYVYRSGSLLAAHVPGASGGEGTQYFHLDHLGTPRLKVERQSGCPHQQQMSSLLRRVHEWNFPGLMDNFDSFWRPSSALIDFCQQACASNTLRARFVLKATRISPEVCRGPCVNRPEW